MFQNENIIIKIKYLLNWNLDRIVLSTTEEIMVFDPFMGAGMQGSKR